MSSDSAATGTPITDTLIEAKNLINIVGWTQDQMVRYAPGPDKTIEAYCMSGAAYTAAAQADIWQCCLIYLREALNIMNISPSLEYSYNDTPGRTKEEVLHVFDVAIGLAKERGC